MNQNLTQRTLTNIAWIGGALIARLGIRIVAVAILARLLTPQEYGIATLAILAMELAALFYQLGLAPALVQREELNMEHVKTAYSTSMLMATLTAVLIWLSAPHLAELMREKAIEDAMRVLCFLAPFLAFNWLGEAILARNGRAKSIAMRPLVGFCFGAFFVAVPMAYLGYGYWSLLWMYATEILISSIIIAFAARNFLPMPGFSLSAFSDLWPISLRFSAIQPLVYLSTNLEKLQIGQYLGPQALGLYSRAAFFVTTATILFNSMSRNTLFPTMSQMQGNNPRLRNGYLKSLAIVSLVSWPLTFYCVVFASDLIEILLGEGWSAAVAPFSILSFIFYFRFSENISTLLLQSQGLPNFVIFAKILTVILLGFGVFYSSESGLNLICVAVLASCVFESVLLMCRSCITLNICLTDIIYAHWPSLFFSCITIVVGAGVNFALPSELSSFFTITISVLSISISIAIITLINPTFFLGSHIAPMFNFLKRKP